MKLKLKYWVLFLLLGICLWFGLPILKPTATASDTAKVLHLLNRIGFGPLPGDIQRIQSTGIEAYIKSQLAPESIPLPPQLIQKLEGLKTLQLTPVELFNRYSPQAGERRQEQTQSQRNILPRRQRQSQSEGNTPPRRQKQSQPNLQMAQKQAQKPLQEAREARLLRAIASPRQLEEVMVDFWFNHFNVFGAKGDTRFWVGAYEEQAIRPHILGSFRDLLEATARHPAMLFYLDNWQNTAPGSPKAKGRFRGLNENYAREVMELHTLGVDGGYTQEDVTTLARILTGWGLIRRVNNGDKSGFYFDRDRHDFSDKIFLGKSIQGSGIDEVEQALDILARHPATAHHISYQLAQYFVADEPPSNLVDSLAQRFQQTDGNIRAVLETLFQSPEFFNTKYYGSKFKTPYQYVISELRAIDAKNINISSISGFLRQLGMPLYGCQTPNGYKNTQSAWLNPDGMIRRVNFATTLANRRNGNKESLDITQLRQTIGNNLSTKTQEVIASSPEKLKAALILGSPEMMRR
ncbi:DUF1800 domain-containing protein [Limnofasciculus baicalensis]|uniref:DUF1800 family protein n=1 Tax=Limnofasciculus baicalensis BBK-W-15 TaxID=2699891 RepID=A0AAE3GQS3_9CYAN|nr:DUF1800 family protein [Limnofasciculus baicalensis]MCP2729010.1 DUF1800 family protein [Limnofasciculus baicalensis BBK-W-15]